VQFIVKDRGSGGGGRKYSCSLTEFRDLGYEELINLKVGYTEFMRNRAQPQLK
jgi:hypothetical protein